MILSNRKFRANNLKFPTENFSSFFLSHFPFLLKIFLFFCWKFSIFFLLEIIIICFAVLNVLPKFPTKKKENFQQKRGKFGRKKKRKIWKKKEKIFKKKVEIFLSEYRYKKYKIKQKYFKRWPGKSWNLNLKTLLNSKILQIVTVFWKYYRNDLVPNIPHFWVDLFSEVTSQNLVGRNN